MGRISMDMCTVDVTHIPECEIGDEVVLMGMQEEEYISAGEIAEKSGTISYEILCALGKRAPRVFVNKGKNRYGRTKITKNTYTGRGEINR